ncbi:MAG: hypothetical protein LBV01_03895 [Deltaproteobacteria bacterium]|jgi:hypothetical protein|nr:hypothetical protein [Deltaproteobacteria bacterium]
MVVLLSSLLMAPVFIACFFCYLDGKTVNHSGMDFSLLILPLILAGGYAFMHRKRFGIWSWLGVASCAVGIAFFIIVVRFNIMVAYDSWLRQGMPDPVEPFKSLFYGDRYRGN